MPGRHCRHPAAIVALYTHMLVREDAQQLYGFASRSERELFRAVLRISGVGPKLALALISAFNANELAQAAADGDPGRLTRVPGIGRKTAQRGAVGIEGSAGGRRHRAGAGKVRRGRVSGPPKPSGRSPPWATVPKMPLRWCAKWEVREWRWRQLFVKRCGASPAGRPPHERGAGSSGEPGGGRGCGRAPRPQPAPDQLGRVRRPERGAGTDGHLHRGGTAARRVPGPHVDLWPAWARQDHHGSHRRP